MGIDEYSLIPSEYFWANRQPLLLARGYKLRRRYSPQWVGSWIVSGKSPLECEDSRISFLWNVMDAVRIRDNVRVALKLVPTFTEEIPIALYLSSEELMKDPRNRTARVSDVVLIPGGDQWALLVTPFLRSFDDPPFQFRCECLEALHQVLQGLEFMHEHNIAHRYITGFYYFEDACYRNIMMDSSRVIPGGYHPIEDHTRDGNLLNGEKIIIKTRSSVSPVGYFFIDFGLSTRFRSLEERAFVTGILGQNKKVPELSNTTPYDPFKVDIYQLGGVIKELLKTYHGLRVLRPLANVMSRSDPARRLTASESLRKFERIVSNLGPEDLQAGIVLRKDWLPVRVIWKFRRRLGLAPVRVGR